MKILLILFLTLGIFTQTFAQKITNKAIIDEVLEMIQNGEEVKAIKSVNKIINDYPSDPYPFLLKALAYEQLSVLDSAICYYDKSIRRDKKPLDALYNLGALYLNRAIEYINKDSSQISIDQELIGSQKYLERYIHLEEDTTLNTYLRTIYKLRNISAQRLDSLYNYDRSLVFRGEKYGLFRFDLASRAEFPGGEDALIKFIGENPSYQN